MPRLAHESATARNRRLSSPRISRRPRTETAGQAALAPRGGGGDGGAGPAGSPPPLAHGDGGPGALARLEGGARGVHLRRRGSAGRAGDDLGAEGGGGGHRVLPSLPHRSTKRR